MIRRLYVTLTLMLVLSLVASADAAPPPPSLLKHGNPGAAGPNILEAVDVNGTFYLSALREEFGKELWNSHGTEHGTVMVKDIYSGLKMLGSRRKVLSHTKFRSTVQPHQST